MAPEQQAKQSTRTPEDNEESVSIDRVGPVQRLERRLSTPAQFKRSTTIEQPQQPEEPTKIITAPSARMSISNDQNRASIPQDKKSAQRFNETSSHSLCRHHRLRHSLGGRQSLEIHRVTTNHKSASPSTSSSASDSAFSQSQTTLESESDRANSFRGSIKTKSLSTDSSSSSSSSSSGDSSVTKKANKNLYRSESGASDSSCGGELNSLDLKKPNHFEIIWKNLSYRVPEKRFARLTAYLKRKKETLWPGEQDELVADYDPPVAVRQRAENESPPLRLPTTGKPRKVIFSDLHGCVKSGKLTAILGPSGAGKTTFLKCLTNSLVRGVSGSIDIVGDKTNRHLKLCIIPQKDYLFDNLTVMENLVFASRIKNTPANFDHMQNVECVANLLGLQSCLKLKTSKLSGGQYKRVSIAQELLSKPDILILDEPTSGLDSLTCFRTVSVLRDLVNMSRAGLMPPLAIVMTIHQPQIKIFNLFHHVYILSSMGQCVYEGKPEYLINTVADCCKLLPPPDDLNPASFIIDLASEVYGSEPIERLAKLQRENSDLVHPELDNSNDNVIVCNKSRSLARIELIVDTEIGKAKAVACNDGNSLVKFEKEVDASIIEHRRKAHQHSIRGDGNPSCDELKISDRLRRRNIHDHSFWLHTGLLVKRLWISMWRDPLLTTTRITFHLIIPFVFYFIYSQKSGAANACPYVEREFDFQNLTSEANIQRLETQHNELILTFENVSLFFLLLYSFSMCVLAVTALSFPLNMQILLKETSNGWYSMPRFVMAKTLADLPIELTMPMVSVSIAYVLTGQPSSYFCWRMLTVTAVMTLCSLISQTQGLLFGAYFMNNVQAAVFVSQASSLPWIMLSGFTTRISELPLVLQWLSFGSIYRLGIESIASVRYGFGMCPCDEELVSGTPIKMVGIPDQLRSVMRYYMDMYSEQPSNSTGDVFEKIASTLSRANTYGVDIVSCHDVRPFILSAREVNEGTLPTFLLILTSIFVGLKILLFCVVRLRTG